MKNRPATLRSETTTIIIAGVNKGGTTSLFSLLAQNSQICGSSVKETCFFLPERYGENCPGEESYWAHFSGWCGESHLLEATPGYFYGGQRLINAVQRVAGPDVKIILILREPVSRVASFFRFKQAMLELPKEMTFYDYIDRCLKVPTADFRKRENNAFFGVTGGCYADYMEPWLSAFAKNIYVTFHDELNDDPAGLAKRLLRWLDLDERQKLEGISARDRDNVTKAIKYRWLQRIAITVNKKMEPLLRKNRGVKSWLRANYYRFNRGADPEPTIDEKSRLLLEKFYAPYNKRLRQLLLEDRYSGDPLPSWLSG